ncbi:MAG: hypothetical protein AAF654_09980 [Myxococcota bacterium]
MQKGVIGYLSAVALLSGCSGDDGSDGANGSNGTDATVALFDEPVGSNCTFGGTRIEVGIDSNRSGALDPDEVTGTTYACDDRAETFEGLIYESDFESRGTTALYVTRADRNTTQKLIGSAIDGGFVAAIVSPDGQQVAVDVPSEPQNEVV